MTETAATMRSATMGETRCGGGGGAGRGGARSASVAGAGPLERWLLRDLGSDTARSVRAGSERAAGAERRAAGALPARAASLPAAAAV